MSTRGYLGAYTIHVPGNNYRLGGLGGVSRNPLSSRGMGRRGVRNPLPA